MFIDHCWAGEVLEYGLKVVSRIGVTAESPIYVERSKERTAATLGAIVGLSGNSGFVGPAIGVELLRSSIRPSVASYAVGIHR